MPVFLLAYDLVNETRSGEYDALNNDLDRLEAQRVQDSVWLVSLNYGVVEVKDHFATFMDGDDKLWVTKLRRHSQRQTAALTAGSKRTHLKLRMLSAREF